jgi:DNA-binding response OmpR family regulator
VEDDEVVRAAIVRTLRGARYQVVEASDGSEALAAVERRGGPIDLLLTDVVLPGMSGAEVARRMREDHPAAKVLFMSGYADTTAHAGVPVGEPGVLQKPFTPDCLCARVRALLDAP